MAAKLDFFLLLRYSYCYALVNQSSEYVGVKKSHVKSYVLTEMLYRCIALRYRLLEHVGTLLTNVS